MVLRKNNFSEIYKNLLDLAILCGMDTTNCDPELASMNMGRIMPKAFVVN